MHISLVLADSPKVSVVPVLFNQVQLKVSALPEASFIGGAYSAGVGEFQSVVLKIVVPPLVASVLGVTTATSDGIGIEVHDSGPGLSPLARGSLFEPTISFKKGGMGLGLSIARKSALLSGGDIVPVHGELGGAAFRVLLPLSPAA